MFAYLLTGRKRVRDIIAADSSSPGAGDWAGGGASAVPLALSQVLSDLAGALVPDARKTELEDLARRIEEAEDVRGVVYLAMHEQATAYAPQYSTP